MGHALHEASVESAKPDEERETAFRGRNLPFMVKRLSKRLKDLHPPHEAALITRAVTMAVDAGLPLGAEVVAALKQVATDLQDGSSPEMAQMSSDDLAKCLAGDMPVPQDAPVVQAAKAIYDVYCSDRDTSKALLSERDKLLAKLLTLQRQHSSETFYPDANSCLRLSAGHVEGYTASDAVEHTPVTTLAGLLDKHVEAALTLNPVPNPVMPDGEFGMPKRVRDLCANDSRVASTPV